MTDQESKGVTFVVVVNDEGQYSIWPAYRDLPPGWRAKTPALAKPECLEHIREHWVDMRPRSLREQLDGHTS